MQSYFEQLVGEEQERVKQALLLADIGNSHRHAQLKGHFEGLGKALDLYRRAARTDLEAAAAA